MTAGLARALGWTMQEVRAHELGDVQAMVEQLQDEARAQRMRAARR